MPIQIYQTRQMLAAINRVKAPKTFLRDTFFPNIQTSVTEKVDVDFKKGRREMAPFVAPRVGGVVMERKGFTTNTYSVPRISPERIITGDDINKRSMGEAVYSVKTPEQRAAEMMGRDLRELDESITRREEWMCREVILNGKVTMRGIIDDKKENYIEQDVDYSFSNKEALSGADLWSDAGSDPYEYLKQRRLDIIKKSGKAPNVVILAGDVEAAFINHPKIKEMNDIRRHQMSIIEPKILNEAVTLIGYLPGLGLEIYRYDEWFIDDDGVEQSMIPSKHIIIGRTGMAKILYGAITQIENNGFVTIEGTRIPKNWVDTNNDVVKLRLGARPLPVPEDVDDWYVAQVLE